MIASVDFDFNVNWCNAYGGDKEDVSHFGVLGPDNGIIIAAENRSYSIRGAKTYTVMRLDSRGNPVWTKTFFDDAQSNVARPIYKIADNHYIVLGIINSVGLTGTDYLVVEFDDDGNILNGKRIDCNNATETGFGFLLTSDGGYVIAGAISGVGAGGWWDLEIIKMDAN